MPSPLTLADIETCHEKLSEALAPPDQGYMVLFEGTKEEYEIFKRKLTENDC